MPQPRNLRATSSRQNVLSTTSSDSESSSDDRLITASQAQLTSALQGFSALAARLNSAHLELATLRARVKLLESQREDGTVVRGKRGTPSAANVKILEAKLQELEQARIKDKKKIEKLQLQEMKNEAKELQEDHEDVVLDDRAHTMRKLLRRFQDLMSAETIGADEECPICTEQMEVGKASSLPCGHVYCKPCLSKLPKLDKGEEVISCPECREQCPREGPETVLFTEDSRWDELLHLAERWGRIDHRGGEETSEEEEHEMFVDDETDNASSALTDLPNDYQGLGEDAISDNGLGPPEAHDTHIQVGTGGSPRVADPIHPDDSTMAVPSTPPPDTAALSYVQSPISQKRKRMELLAEQRAQRRRM